MASQSAKLSGIAFSATVRASGKATYNLVSPKHVEWNELVGLWRLDQEDRMVPARWQFEGPYLRQVFLSRNQFTAEALSTSLAQLMNFAPDLERLDCSYNKISFQPGLLERSPSAHQDWETQQISSFAQALERHGSLRHFLFPHIRPQVPAIVTPFFVSQVFGAPESAATLQLDMLALDGTVGSSTEKEWQ